MLLVLQSFLPEISLLVMRLYRDSYLQDQSLDRRINIRNQFKINSKYVMVGKLISYHPKYPQVRCSAILS